MLSRFALTAAALASAALALGCANGDPGATSSRPGTASAQATTPGVAALQLRPREWYRDRGIEVLIGCRVQRIDPEAAALWLKDGGRRGFRAVSEVAESCGTGRECGGCKPALAYLLSEINANRHREERAARFINDRVHTNIQNDGTFSVVPRMYGG